MGTRDEALPLFVYDRRNPLWLCSASNGRTANMDARSAKNPLCNVPTERHIHHLTRGADNGSS